MTTASSGDTHTVATVSEKEREYLSTYLHAACKIRVVQNHVSVYT